MKIKIIDLLNKIANDEEIPTKIKYNYITWEWNEKQKDYIELNGATRNLFTYYLDNLTEWLNNGIEIIEEEKKIELPEKLNYNEKEFEDDAVDLKYSKGILRIGNVINELSKKIDETLDYIKYKEDKEKEK